MPSAIQAFDAAILHFLNGFVGACPGFDKIVHVVSYQTLVKGGLIMALYWWIWQRKSEQTWEQRGRLLMGIAGGLASVLVARLCAAACPFRLRPLLQPELHMNVVPGLDPSDLIHWSSFPSDHAAMFTALAVGLLSVSRGFGCFALAHAALVICFPRVYLGLHHPTDILAGAVLGAGTGLCCQWSVAHGLAARLARRWEGAHAPSFYAALFLLTFEIAELFSAVREIAVSAWHMLHKAL